MRADHLPAEQHSMGVRARTAQLRECNGVTAEAIEWFCEGPSRFELTCDSYRIGFVLEQSGGKCETRTNPGITGGYVHRGKPFVSLSPPGMQVWACSDGIPYTRSLSLAFGKATLTERLGDDADTQDLTPSLNFEHPRLSALAELLARECRTKDALGDLYVEGLIVGILVEVARLGQSRTEDARTTRLAPWQLRLAIEYMEAQIGDRVLLRDLARATRLSQSHFSRAFKASTGVPPYQWHLNARITRAQQLLLDTTLSLADVAAATGFADQAHLTRMFRRVTGATPAVWQKDRMR